jgi:protein-L-isoaspartate O-methyltransferase
LHLDYLDIHKLRSVLEIGCGTGLGSWILSDLTNNIIAIEPSPSNVGMFSKEYIF